MEELFDLRYVQYKEFCSFIAFWIWELLLCQAEKWELCEEFWKTDPSIEKYVLAIVYKNACFYTSTLKIDG